MVASYGPRRLLGGGEPRGQQDGPEDHDLDSNRGDHDWIDNEGGDLGERGGAI